MDRRSFLKSLLGLAAGAALPPGFEAVVDHVAMPGVAAPGLTEYILHATIKRDGGSWEAIHLPFMARDEKHAIEIVNDYFSREAGADVDITELFSMPPLETYT